MPEKSILAPLDGQLITKSAFQRKNSEYRMCSRCVMDTTDPHIEFNGDGVCSHCTRFDYSIRPLWEKVLNNDGYLNQVISQIKKEGDGKEYDCIVGLSGGIDSSYLAIKLKEWGLRPLAVHIDAGWNSELAVKNIEEICKRLEIELVTHVIDWEQMRDLQLAFIKSSVANQDTPQDHVFFAALYKYAIDSKIKYVMEGRNYATESVLPTSWGYTAMDLKHIKAIKKAFGKKRNLKLPTVSFFNYNIYFPIIKKMKRVAPLNMISYNKDLVIGELEKFGWSYYGGKHYESRWTKFFQSYYLPYKFGYDKRKAHLSSLILSEQKTRDESLRELRKPLVDKKELSEDIRFVSKKLNITEDELIKNIEDPVRHHTEFPNNEKFRNRYSATLKVLSKIKKVYLKRKNKPTKR